MVPQVQAETLAQVVLQVHQVLRVQVELVEVQVLQVRQVYQV